MGRDVKVIDRTALILDIFALHATSKEGRLQVRLAQNEYLLPRLLRGAMWCSGLQPHGRRRWSRFGEARNRRRGRPPHGAVHRPSKRELKHVAEVRAVQRESRYESGMFKVALAGYTNAGKSSLLNRLTNADVLAYDKLFATLDSTTRKFELPEGREITITDTVGFIQKLPTTLIEAFKSTLDEITGADLVLHVVDASSDEYEAQIAAVEDVLGQIQAQDLLRVLVFNKCDLLDEEHFAALKARHPQAQFASAATGEGVGALVDHIARVASAQDEHLDVLIPYSRGDLVSIAHERCHILSERTRRRARASSCSPDPFVRRAVQAVRAWRLSGPSHSGGGWRSSGRSRSSWRSIRASSSSSRGGGWGTASPSSATSCSTIRRSARR